MSQNKPPVLKILLCTFYHRKVKGTMQATSLKRLLFKIIHTATTDRISLSCKNEWYIIFVHASPVFLFTHPQMGIYVDFISESIMIILISLRIQAVIRAVLDN